MSKYLIVGGVILISVGLLWPYLNKIGLFNLPGDIMIKKEGYTIHFPIVTCIVISMTISFIFWIIRNFR
ncbi:MAG: DUF2905 domain-containing protein [Oligoflexales bacterium]|nr:DUF2905 domain-containing protein [Oligoflexales bacterium]